MQLSGIAQIWHLINVRECTGQMKSDFETEDTVMFRKIFQVVKDIYPLKRQPHKMVKHTQTIRRQQSTNFLSVFDLLVELTANHTPGSHSKGLIVNVKHLYKITPKH